MIRDYNIANDAAIMPHKIVGLDIDQLVGDTFYVAKVTTQAWSWLNQRVGTEKLVPTLKEALAICTADRNDKIIIAPNHSETITGAGGITLNKAGVSIRGMGRYNQRPTFLMDGAGASMLVTSANMVLDNCIFPSGHANLAYFALITAKGFRFSNNYVGENIATEDWVIAMSVSSGDNDADGLEILHNEFIGIGATATGCIVLNKDIADCKLIGNKIVGEFGVTPFAPILQPDGEIATNVQIYHNHIHNLHNADSVVGISMLEAVSTGWMMYNHVYALDVTGETPFLTGATGIYCSQNMTAYAATDSGFEYPAIGTV